MLTLHLSLILTLTLTLILILTLTLSERNAFLWRPVNYNLARVCLLSCTRVHCTGHCTLSSAFDRQQLFVCNIVYQLFVLPRMSCVICLNTHFVCVCNAVVVVHLLKASYKSLFETLFRIYLAAGMRRPCFCKTPTPAVEKTWTPGPKLDSEDLLCSIMIVY